jgi:hypothetical protein
MLSAHKPAIPQTGEENRPVPKVLLCRAPAADTSGRPWFSLLDCCPHLTPAWSGRRAVVAEVPTQSARSAPYFCVCAGALREIDMQVGYVRPRPEEEGIEPGTRSHFLRAAIVDEPAQPSEGRALKFPHLAQGSGNASSPAPRHPTGDSAQPCGHGLSRSSSPRVLDRGGHARDPTEPFVTSPELRRFGVTSADAQRRESAQPVTMAPKSCV